MLLLHTDVDMPQDTSSDAANAATGSGAHAAPAATNAPTPHPVAAAPTDADAASPPPRPQSVFIRTYGCQMNASDSELVSSILTSNGYSLTPDEAEADVVLLNTCAIREKAEARIWGKLQLLKHQRDARESTQGSRQSAATGRARNSDAAHNGGPAGLHGGAPEG